MSDPFVKALEAEVQEGVSRFASEEVAIWKEMARGLYNENIKFRKALERSKCALDCAHEPKNAMEWVLPKWEHCRLQNKKLWEENSRLSDENKTLKGKWSPEMADQLIANDLIRGEIKKLRKALEEIGHILDPHYFTDDALEIINKMRLIATEALKNG